MQLVLLRMRACACNAYSDAVLIVIIVFDWFYHYFYPLSVQWTITNGYMFSHFIHTSLYTYKAKQSWPCISHIRGSLTNLVIYWVNLASWSKILVLSFIFLPFLLFCYTLHTQWWQIGSLFYQLTPSRTITYKLSILLYVYLQILFKRIYHFF